MSHHFYEVQVECFNAKGEVYLSQSFRYSKRHSALQKMSALKRHHPTSVAVLVKKDWSGEESASLPNGQVVGEFAERV